MQEHEESALREAFAPARELEEADSVVAGALAEDSGRGQHHRQWRRGLIALMLIVGVPATAVAVVRGFDSEPGSAGEPLVNYARGDAPESWPGEPFVKGVSSGPAIWEAPRKRLAESNDPRILATRGRSGLFVSRADTTEAASVEDFGLLFELPSEGVGLGVSARELIESSRDKVTAFLGGLPHPDEPARARKGLVPLYGLAADDVDRVRVRYKDGRLSETVDADGGFIVLVKPRLRPSTIEGLDSDGNVVGRGPAAVGAGWQSRERDLARVRAQLRGRGR